MNIKQKCKDGWNYVKEHKAEMYLIGAGVLGTGIIVVSAITGVKLYKLDKSTRKEGKDILDSLLKSIPETIAKIDEDIFTDLAPAISDVVTNKGVQRAVIERSYDLGENLIKDVMVTIKTA